MVNTELHRKKDMVFFMRMPCFVAGLVVQGLSNFLVSCSANRRSAERDL